MFVDVSPLSRPVHTLLLFLHEYDYWFSHVICAQLLFRIKNARESHVLSPSACSVECLSHGNSMEDTNSFIVVCLTSIWCGWDGLMIAIKTSVKATYQCWAKQEEARLGFRVCVVGLPRGSRSPRVVKISLDTEWEVRSLFLSAELETISTRAGLEKDDERNPACLAGNVDDKVVGRCRHEDVFGSCAESTWAALALVASSEALEHSWKALMCPVLDLSLSMEVGVMKLVLSYAMCRVQEEYGAHRHCAYVSCGRGYWRGRVCQMFSTRVRQSIDCSGGLAETTVWPLHRLRHGGLHLQVMCLRARNQR